ncbi:MAG: pitrilysin family protein [Myxococcales bacterium]|jgi:zinc protease
MSRFRTRAGSVVITERSDALPVVGVGVSLRIGSLSDPVGKEGLTRLMARAMRMGGPRQDSLAVEQALDGLGAQLSMAVSQSYMHVGGVVVKHNLESFVELLSTLLLRPALRARDVAQVKREAVAELTAMADDDRILCARNFRRFAFGEHPYARSRTGSRKSVHSLTRKDVVAHHQRLMRGDNLVIGVWGDFELRPLRRLLDTHLGEAPTGEGPRVELPEPTLAPGRRILVVDKPDRSQTQVIIGTLGTRPRDREHVPMIVANTAFGGLFTSRLMNEVRSKRGWSYGASSAQTQSLTRDLWAMHTHPAATDARACIELQLSLYDRWVERGLTARELKASKGYLIKGHAFEVDTPAKRLDQDLDPELFGWPRDLNRRFVERVRKVERQDVARALRRRMSRRDQVITVVATADQLVPELEKLPDVASIDVVPFDRI